jgi:hypothetical protein
MSLATMRHMPRHLNELLLTGECRRSGPAAHHLTRTFVVHENVGHLPRKREGLPISLGMIPSVRIWLIVLRPHRLLRLNKRCHTRDRT